MDLYSGYSVEVGVECTWGGGNIDILFPPLTLVGEASRGMVVHRNTGTTEVDWVMGSVYIEKSLGQIGTLGKMTLHDS